MNKRIVLPLLIVILLFGSFLRFYNIGEESLWVDESGTALLMKNYDLAGVAHNTIINRQILPLGYLGKGGDLPVYYLLLKLWTGISSVSESSLRIFSAFFGVLSILLVYFMSKELFNEKTGLIASFIFSLHAIMLEYSQEARLYNFMIFIVLLASYSLIKSIRAKSNTFFAVFILSNLIGIYTSPIFLFFFIFEGLYIFYITLKNNFNDNKLFIGFILLIIAYLPVIYRLIRASIAGLRYSGKLSLFGIAKIFLAYNTWIYSPAPYGFLIILSAVIITAILSFGFIRALIKPNKSLIFAVAMLVIPFIAFFIMLYKVISVFPSNRYIIYTVPVYVIISAFGLSQLKKKYLAFIFPLFIIASTVILSSFYIYPIHPEYREAVAFLEQNANKNDVLIASTPSIKLAFDYYSDKFYNLYPVLNLDDAKKAIENHNSAWLILSTKYADQKGELRDYFGKNYDLGETKEFYDVNLTHYTRRKNKSN